MKVRRVFWAVVMMMFYSSGCWDAAAATAGVVNVGCMLILDSPVGKVTKLAVEAAVEDINSNPTLLPATKLNLTLLDTTPTAAFLPILQGTKMALLIFTSTSLASKSGGLGD
ncbi:unnamed protein product [Cuscuta europaea]|uniref:Uncharacterized protein n=1 Tax=Cuscuta europaea TaxID=41803 RepID=A0A9P0Z899_CUSEU|nr:unnamed protein product [Cuscuta europaea]